MKQCRLGTRSFFSSQALGPSSQESFSAHLRGVARYYDVPVFPYFARNVAFSQIPGGLMFLLLGSASLLWGSAESVAIGLLVGGMFCGVVCVLVTLDPPTFLKPQWMRHGERWNGRADDQVRVTYQWPGEPPNGTR
jgi:hypothetical protein